MPTNAKETFEKIINSTYEWMRSARTPAGFYCPIKKKHCIDVEYGCNECPLKDYFTEKFQNKDHLVVL